MINAPIGVPSGWEERAARIAHSGNGYWAMKDDQFSCRRINPSFRMEETHPHDWRVDE